MGTFGRRLCWLVLASLAALLLSTAPATAQETEVALHVTSIERDDASGEVRIDISAPIDLIGEQILAENVLVVVGNENQSVAIEAVPNDDIEVVLALDISGSMQGAGIESARAAALSFLELLPESVDVSVVSFSDTATTRAPFGSSRDFIAASINALEAGGETALFDAVVVAADQFVGSTSKRRYVVLLTDGLDTASRATLSDARIALLMHEIAPYAVALATDQLATAPLEELVADTAGRVDMVEAPEALKGLYDELAAELGSRFTLTFTPRTDDKGLARIVISQAGTIASSTIPYSKYEPADGLDDPQVIAELPAPPRPPDFVATPSVAEPSAFSSETTRNLGIGLLSAFIFVAALLVGLPTEKARRHVDRTRLAIEDTSFKDMVERIKGTVDRGLESKGHSHRLKTTLESAGLALRPAEFVGIVTGLGFVALLVVTVVFGAIPGLIAAVLTFPIAKKYLARKARKRRGRFVEQLPATVQLLAGALRAGHTLPQAVIRVAEETQEPTCDEFHRVMTENRLGRDFGEALHAVDGRMESVDFAWVVQAVDIHRQVGGDLAEVLDNVYETIRDRNYIQRQFAAVSAEARYSAYLIVSLPFVVFVMMLMTNPEYISVLFTEPLGWVAVGLATTLIGMGTMTMKALLKVKY